MAIIAATAHSIMELNCLKLGFGRHIWDIRAIILLDHSNVRLMSATALIYPFVIYFVKISILLLYLRIFGVHRPLELAAKFAIVFFTLFYVSYVGVQAGFLANCVTVAALKSGLCKSLYPLTIFQAAFNLVSDVFVFALPIPQIMGLHVSKRQKIGLLFIFLAGLVACSVSLARLIATVITLNRTDKFWYSALLGSFT